MHLSLMETITSNFTKTKNTQVNFGSRQNFNSLFLLIQLKMTKPTTFSLIYNKHSEEVIS